MDNKIEIGVKEAVEHAYRAGLAEATLQSIQWVLGSNAPSVDLSDKDRLDRVRDIMRGSGWAI